MTDALEATTNAVHAKAFDPFRHLPRRERIKQVINGIPHATWPAEEHSAGWIEWAERGAILIRYEQLLSGDAVPVISHTLRIPNERVSEVLKMTIGQPTITLNKGVPSRWRSELDDELLELLKKRTGDLVERLGYAW